VCVCARARACVYALAYVCVLERVCVRLCMWCVRPYVWVVCTRMFDRFWFGDNKTLTLVSGRVRAHAVV